VNLSAIRQQLAALDLRPAKSLGQNFLHDQNLAVWIVQQLALTAEDHLVEIGPGLGALTESALPLCGSAILIEKDRRLAGALRARFASDRVEVLNADALDYDPRELFPRAPAKLLGNLPYNITSPVLFHFTDEPSPIERAVITTQREFAERLAAHPRTKDYGALTLLVQRRWRVQNVRTIPGSVFFPAPQVESAVLVLTPRPAGELPDCDGALFRSLVRAGFSQRRKQLRKMISDRVPDWPALATQIGATDTARAEELSLEQWIALANFVSPSPTAAQDVHGERFDVVDENNVVERTATRHEVHTQKLRHRAVHVFVFNAAGELFLQKRSRWKDAHPGKWDSSAAGHVNAGQDYDETAAREVEEELGVRAPVEFVAKIAACSHTGWEFVQLYRVQHNGPFVLCRAEIETGGFFPVPLIARWIAARPRDFATGFLECFAVSAREER
jgi:16S rRNA (adenine1518-N6/adenine1519-N6)-dimethyltransferase